MQHVFLVERMCSRCMRVSISTSSKRISFHGRPSAKARSTRRAPQLRCVPFTWATCRHSHVLTKLCAWSLEDSTACQEKQAHVQTWNECVRGMRAHTYTHTHTKLVLPLFLLQLHACILCAHACTASRFSSNSVRPLQQREPRLHRHMHAMAWLPLIEVYYDYKDMCWSVPHMPATSGCTRSTQRIASVTVEAGARKVLCGKTERRPQSTGTNL